MGYSHRTSNLVFFLECITSIIRLKLINIKVIILNLVLVLLNIRNNVFANPNIQIGNKFDIAIFLLYTFILTLN